MNFCRKFGTYLTLRFISSVRLGSPLLLMVALAIAALALYFVSDTGHAQVPQVTPSTPVVTLHSCDAGCLVIDAGTLTYSDDSTLTLPDSGTYLASTNAEVPLVEVQWRFTGDEDWEVWDYVSDSDVHWGTRRNDVSGQIEVRGLASRYHDVRVRVLDPEDTTTASEWSDVVTGKPSAWPGVIGIRLEYTEGELHGEYPITVSWRNPPDDPGYSSYYVGVSPNDHIACHAGPDITPYQERSNYFNAHVIGETSVVLGESEAWTDGVARSSLKACVRPAVGTGDGIQAAEALSQAATPSASYEPHIGNGTINGSPYAPEGVDSEFSPLLDWRKIYLSWDELEIADGSTIRESEWQYRVSDSLVLSPVDVDTHGSIHSFGSG